MIVSRRQTWGGTAILIVVMAVTLIPFVSLFTTALHESGTYPSGLDWPSHPHWHNFIDHLAAGKDDESFFVSVVAKKISS